MDVQSTTSPNSITYNTENINNNINNSKILYNYSTNVPNRNLLPDYLPYPDTFTYNSNIDKRICSINLSTDIFSIFDNKTWSIMFSSMLSDRYCIQNNIYSIFMSPLYFLAFLSNDKEIKVDLNKEIVDFNTYKRFNTAKLDACIDKDPYCTIICPIGSIHNALLISIENSKQRNDSTYFTEQFLGRTVPRAFLKDSVNFNFDQKSFKNLGSGVTFTYLNKISSNDIDNCISDIKFEIYKNGPVFSSFFMMDSFVDYVNKYFDNPDPQMIYINNMDINTLKYNGKNISKMPININGWGIINGIEYWECKFLKNGQFIYIKIATSKSTNIQNLIGIDIGFSLDKDYDSCSGAFSMSLQKLSNHDDLVKKEIFKKYDGTSNNCPNPGCGGLDGSGKNQYCPSTGAEYDGKIWYIKMNQYLFFNKPLRTSSSQNSFSFYNINNPEEEIKATLTEYGFQVDSIKGFDKLPIDDEGNTINIDIIQGNKFIFNYENNTYTRDDITLFLRDCIPESECNYFNPDYKLCKFDGSPIHDGGGAGGNYENDNNGERLICANLKTDNYNCGSCGNTCPINSTCKNGTCICNGNWQARSRTAPTDLAGFCSYCPPNFDNFDNNCTKCSDYYYGDKCQNDCLINTQIFYNLQNQSVPFSLYDKNCCAFPLQYLLKSGNLLTTIPDLTTFISDNKIQHSSLLIILVGNLTLNKYSYSDLIEIDNKTYLIRNDLARTIGPYNLSITNNYTKQTIKYNNVKRTIGEGRCRCDDPFCFNWSCNLTYHSVKFDENNQQNYKKFSLNMNGKNIFNIENLPEILIIGPELSQDQLCITTSNLERRLYPNGTYPPNYDKTEPTYQKCANNWTGINCDVCPPNFNQDNNCQGCINFWQGTDCQTCPSNIKQDGNCNKCESGYTGDNCDIKTTSIPCTPKCLNNCGQNNGCGGQCPNTKYNDIIINNPLIFNKNNYWNLYKDKSLVYKVYSYKDTYTPNFIVFSDSYQSRDYFSIYYNNGNNKFEIGTASGTFSFLNKGTIDFNSSKNIYNITVPNPDPNKTILLPYIVYYLVPSFCDS